MVEHDGRRPSLSFWIVIVAGLFALPAVLNGFPFVFADSADYLVFTPQLHRSPFYAPLIFVAHLNAWPFGIVLLQTLIMAHLLFLLVRVCLSAPWVGVYLSLSALLAALTALPWVAGQIMPDVFTAVTMLSIYLLGFHLGKLGRLERIYLVLLLTGAVSVHVSHVPAALGLVLLTGVLLLTRRLALAEVGRRLVLIGAPVGAAAAASFAYFAAIHDVSALSPSGPVFFMANLIEHGPARNYLESACPEAGLRLCALVDRLPATANEFLWFTGQLQELGGFAGMREEAAAVVARTIQTRPLEVASLALGNTARQLVTFGLGGAYGPFLRPHMTELMALKFGSEGQAAYLASLQSQQALPLTLINRVHGLTLGLSAVVAVAVLAAALHFRFGGLFAAAVYVTACLVGNAALTGVFSGVYDRYQARVAWLLVVFAVLGGVLVVRRLAALRTRAPAATAGPEPVSFTG